MNFFDDDSPLEGSVSKDELLARARVCIAQNKQNIFDRLANPNPEKKERFRVPSGYSALDLSLGGGFESRRTFVFGGLNKSGKSTLLMNILNNMLLENIKVGYVDTELGPEDFIRRFCAVSNCIHEFDPENTQELQNSWKELFFDCGLLKYGYKSEFFDGSGLISAELVIQKFEEWRLTGVQVFTFDNITTIQNTLTQKKGFELLRDFMGKLIDWAREQNVVLFLVLHTKGNELKFAESSEKINKAIEDKNPHKVFEKSVTVNIRPSVASLYGGQGILSQITGGMLLIWRPFQDFKDPSYQKMGMLILEDFRSKPKDFENEIEMDFEVSTSRYKEVWRYSGYES